MSRIYLSRACMIEAARLTGEDLAGISITLSACDRRANLNHALVAFLDKLGGGQFNTFWVLPGEYPSVLPTTWTALVREGWLRDEDMTPEVYQLTALGYVQALALSGRSKDVEFLNALGRICKVLKDALNERSGSALIYFYDLVKQAAVPEAFAYNAIEADLIRHILGRIGARWEGELLIEVPIDFGHTPF